MPKPNYFTLYSGSLTRLKDYASAGRIAMEEGNQQKIHRHNSEYELHYFKRSKTNYEVDGNGHEVRSHQLVLVPPGADHGPQEGRFGSCDLWWIKFSQENENSVCFSRREWREIVKGLDRLTRAGFVTATQELENSLKHFMKCHLNNSEFSAIKLRLAYSDIIVQLAELIDKRGRLSQTECSQEVSSAKDWMHANVGENCSVDHIADQVGMSSRQFHERFRRETGYTPADYFTRVKIHKAMVEINTTYRSITEIAHSLGFSSSQYFATVFKKHVGKTPQEERGRNLMPDPG